MANGNNGITINQQAVGQVNKVKLSMIEMMTGFVNSLGRAAHAPVNVQAILSDKIAV